MIKREAIDKILQVVIAGKEEAPQPQGEQPPKVVPAPQEAPADTATYMKRYYFYSLGNEIKFNDLKAALDNDSTRQTTVNNLKGGMTGVYWADYFAWKKLIVKKSDGAGNVVIYEANLQKDGRLNPPATLMPKEGAGTPEDFAKRNNLFVDKNGRMVIALDTSGNSLYSSENPEGMVEKLKTQAIDVGPKYKAYDTFKAEVFDTFRILDETNRILVLPDNEPAKAVQNTPRGEEWAYGAYPGGEKAFKTYIAKYDKGGVQENPEGEAPAEEGAPEQPEEAPADLFRPVTNEPTPTAQPVMPKMAAVWQVIRGHMEKQAIYQQTTTTPATTNPKMPQTPGQKPKGPVFPGGTTPQEADKAMKAVADYKKVLEETQKL